MRRRPTAGSSRARSPPAASTAWLTRCSQPRSLLAWFQPLRAELFAPDRFPIFNVEVEEGHFYGFPVHGIPGFKLGRYHHLGERGDADELDREPRAEDEALLRSFTERYFPDGAGPTMTLKA